MTDELRPQFLTEFFKVCFANRTVFDIAIKHLNYSYLPSEQYKRIWKVASDYHKLTQSLPTIGIISQYFDLQDDQDIFKLLQQIKDSSPPSSDKLIGELERFIKEAKFLVAHGALADAWNEGDKDKAYHLLTKFSEEIVNFSLAGSSAEAVWRDFSKRDKERIDAFINHTTHNVRNTKIPFGIDELDYHTGGGMSLADTACFLLQSGAGKSTLLRWIGLSAARRGYKVVHFQGEDTKELCFNQYDSTWTGMKLDDIEYANIPATIRTKLGKSLKSFRSKGGDIFVQAYEQFDSVSMLDVKRDFDDLNKMHGPFHLALFDYLELFDPGDGNHYGPKYERARQLATAKKMKNFAMEYNVAVATGTQASSVSPVDLNDPAFVMTRFNTGEAKALLNSFSYFVTGNQTKGEYEKEIMRLWCEKFRKRKANQLIHIYQHRSNGRFYDRKRTLNEFWDAQTNKSLVKKEEKPKAPGEKRMKRKQVPDDDDS